MLLELCTLIACKQSNPNSSFQEQEEKVQFAPKHVPDHHVRDAVNPRTGRRERVFVDLESVYPDCRNPEYEVSFEELRAIKRGWMSKIWRPEKGPLQTISGNAGLTEPHSAKVEGPITEDDLPQQFDEKLTVNSRPFQTQQQDGIYDGKSGKSRRFKIQGETQTSKSAPNVVLTLCSDFLVQPRVILELRKTRLEGDALRDSLGLIIS